MRSAAALKKTSSRFALIILGTFIYAVGLNFFMKPNGLISGGVTGISMVINYMAPSVPIGLMIFVMNVPLFVIGGKLVGWRFMVGSLIGMLALSIWIDVVALFAVPLTDDPLLGSIFGGVITGFGLGVVFSTGASTGGTDIIAKLLRKKFLFLNIGQLLLGLDLIIILAYSILFKTYELGMYSLIMIFIESKLIDVVLYGINYGKVVFIISDKSDTITQAITKKLDRGVTKLYGSGGYSGTDKVVLLCAIKRRQITELKRVIKECDPNAFVIMSETREVLGNGFQMNEV